MRPMHDRASTLRASNLYNLKSRRKLQNFFELQELAEIKDRVSIRKTCLRGAGVEKNNFSKAFKFAIAVQKVCNNQNPRTLGFRGLSSGILAKK